MLKIILVLCIGLLCGSCGDYSNVPLKDDLLKQDAEFLGAVPSKSALEMRIAENQPRCDDDCKQGVLQVQPFELGDRAHYLDFAVRLTTAYNQSIFGFLDMVDWLTHLVPPSFREHDRRDWGPFRSDENQDVEVRFVMRKNAQESKAEYDLYFQMRWFKATQARDEAWKDCVFGQVSPMIGVRRGKGELTIDLGKCSEFNNIGEQGSAFVEYDTTLDAQNPSGKTQMKIDFAKFLGKEEASEEAKPLTASYNYAEASDFSGRFEFSGLQDIVEGNPAFPHQEEYRMIVLWNNERAGTAEVTLSKGDLGAQLIRVDECWDESLSRVFYEESHDPNTKEGDPADCVEF